MKLLIVSLFMHRDYSSLTGSMSGDSNPSAYSVVNLDIDTVDGPVAVRPSVMGYLNSLEGMHFPISLVNWVTNLTDKCGHLIESVIAETKLERANLTSSFFELPSEPNYGPFPQYNVIVEDAPLEGLEDIISPKMRRRYKSSLESVLRNLINEANHEYTRLETLLVNPRQIFTNAVPGMEALKRVRADTSSLFQDHEQYIDPNVMPFQEITIHPESAVPVDGFNGQAKFPLLDLNRTGDLMELEFLQVDEVVMEKKLELVVSMIMPKQTTTTPRPPQR